MVLKVSGPRQFVSVFFNNSLSVHPAVNGYATLFKTGEDEGDEEKEEHPTSVTPLTVHIDSN